MAAEKAEIAYHFSSLGGPGTKHKLSESEIAERRERGGAIDTDHLTFSATLSFKTVQSYDGDVEHLPVNEAAAAVIRLNNALNLIT